MSVSILEILVERLRATADGYHDGAEEAPVVILWTDPEGAWKPVVAQLQGLMPELLMLGDYAPEQKTGPVIWLKCAIAGTVRKWRYPKASCRSSTFPVWLGINFGPPINAPGNCSRSWSCSIAEPSGPIPTAAIGRLKPSSSLQKADRKSTRLNSSHANISYAVFCLK